ncbi:MAG: hypothetical protein HYT19_01430, partial [Candidatus Nealsonbacteria bacterium]|nr:hypothetical protein [Candidatus Nealsonbacteria bacterium]
MDRESNYISLQDATKICDYTQEYLSLRARQGKLKAVKFGRNWVTKEDWLKEYLVKVEDYNHNFNNGAPAKFLGTVPENLPVEPDEETIVKIKLNSSTSPTLWDEIKDEGKTLIGKFFPPVLKPIFSLGLVFVLFAANIAFGKEDLSQVFKTADQYVLKIGENSDLIAGKIFQSGKTLIAQGREGTEIIFSDIVEETKKSFNNADSKILTFSKIIDFGTAEIGKGISAVKEMNLFSTFASASRSSIKDYFSWLKQNYFSANDFVEEKIVDAGTEARNLVFGARNQVSKTAENLVFGISNGYIAANNFVEEKIRNSVSNIRNRVSKVGNFVSSPWKLLPSRVVEVKKEDLEKIQKDVEALKAGKTVVKEVEVSKVTRVEPVREITKEIFKVDDKALAQVRAQLIDMEGEIAKRLYAPGGVITQQIYIKEPVASPKIYQENGDIILQTAGSGNVILSAATGMQISGSQVVIDSTSLNNPLVYIADKTKIGGNTEIGGALSASSVAVGSVITAQRMTLNAPADYTGKILDLQLGGQSQFSVDYTGTMLFNSGLTSSSTLNVYGTTTLATLQGYVGIGTTTPASTLFVYGASTFMNGNVGIGTTTPSSLLELLSATTTQLTITTASSTYDPQIVFRTGITPTSRFTLGLDQSDSNKFKIATSTLGTLDILVIDPGTGFMGIGTTTPSTTLMVYGTSTFLGANFGIGTTT